MFFYDITSIYILFLNVFAFVLLVVLVFFVLKVYKRSTASDVSLVKHVVYKKAMLLLDTAQTESVEIIEAANRKAQKVLKDANLLTEAAKTMLNDQVAAMAKSQRAFLEKMTADVLQNYADSLKTASTQNMQTMRSVSTDLEKAALAEVSDFKEALHNETVEIERRIEDVLQKEQQKVHKDLATYRSQQLSKIDEEISAIIFEVSKEVIGKGMNITEHQDMVLTALKDAKNKKVFGNGVAQHQRTSDAQ